jgi:hypothetical protein
LYGIFTGAAESGKSTLVKQMKIIHNEGFTFDELLAFKVRYFSCWNIGTKLPNSICHIMQQLGQAVNLCNGPYTILTDQLF